MLKRQKLLLITLMIMVLLPFLFACPFTEKNEEYPDSPKNLVATAGDGWATLTWEAPDTFGSAPLLRYEVRRDGAGGDTWISTGASMSHTFTNLVNLEYYRLDVRAVTSVGASSYSSKTVQVRKPGQNKLGGTAPYETAGDWLFNLVLTGEFAFTFDIKSWKDNSLEYTDHLSFSAKNSNYHLYTYSLSGTSSIKLGEDEWKYIKSTNHYDAYEYNFYTHLWGLFPLPFDQESMEALLTGAIARFWMPMYVFADIDWLKFTTETKVIFGRTCERYVFNVYGLSSDFGFWVDKVTGLTLEYNVPDSDYRETMTLQKFDLSDVPNIVPPGA